MKRLKPAWLLALFVLLNLVIAKSITPDYGLSTDESNERRRSELAFQIYTNQITYDLHIPYEELGLAGQYGTASSMLMRFAEHWLYPDSNHDTGIVAHFGYFLFFQAAVVGVFLLSRQFLNDWISLAAALLFGTQPLLFGHAFINPKDIPLLTVFLFTVVSGFQMIDRWNNLPQKTQPQRSTRRLEAAFLAVLVVLVLLLWSRSWVMEQSAALVEYAYRTQESSLIGRLFSAITIGASLEDYLVWMDLTVQNFYHGLSFSVITPLILLGMFFFAQKKHLFAGRVNLFLLGAAAIWGFAISTRVIAFAAGGIVGLYGLLQQRKKAVLPLGIYLLTAAAVACLTWPVFSIFGLRGLANALTVINNFPWEQDVLFAGQYYAQGKIPLSYLPQLMALQFTIPMVMLALAGMILSVKMMMRSETNSPKMGLLFAWFFLPLIHTMLSDATNYSNFRQYLFITVPLFVFAGVALQALASRIRQPAWNLLMVLLVLLPGLISIVQLHPYQYMYYNALTGGVAGAAGKYPLDYWNTAYKEAMDYVNANLPPESTVLVWKDNRLGRNYAVQDFYFLPHNSVEESEYPEYDYALMPAEDYQTLPTLKDAPVLYTVEVEGVPLVVVLQIQPDGDEK